MLVFLLSSLHRSHLSPLVREQLFSKQPTCLDVFSEELLASCSIDRAPRGPLHLQTNQHYQPPSCLGWQLSSLQPLPRRALSFLLFIIIIKYLKNTLLVLVQHQTQMGYVLFACRRPDVYLDVRLCFITSSVIRTFQSRHT